jgi:CRP-like cAMP-binding protein
MPHPSNRSAIDLFVERLLSHSELSAEEREAVAALPATRMEVNAHRDIVRLGETVDHSCLIEQGLVGRFGQTETGSRQIVSVHVAGEMVDLHSLMVPQASTALNALTSSVVLRVPHRALRELGVCCPAIAAAFWRDCVLQASIVAQWLVNVGRRDARSRLAHLLCEMAIRSRRLGQPPSLRYEFPMTQEQIGDVLGLTAVHVNRMLTALRDDNLVAISRGFVEILDWSGLADAAEFDPTYLHLKNGGPP